MPSAQNKTTLMAAAVAAVQMYLAEEQATTAARPLRAMVFTSPWRLAGRLELMQARDVRLTRGKRRLRPSPLAAVRAARNGGS